MNRKSEKSKKKDKNYSPAAWVPTLYFAEGLPFVATTTVSVLMYKSLGLTDTQIALFTNMIMLPWSLKPIWSPLLEMFKTKKYFVIVTQFMGGILFGLLALTLPLKGFLKYSLALFFIIGFNSATHDISADGVYINSLNREQQSKYVGWQGAFYNIAKILSQGGLVYIAGRLEIAIGVVKAWMVVMSLIGVILLLLSIYHSKVLPVGGEIRSVRSVKEAFITFFKVVKTFFEKKYILWGIAFLILFRTSEGQLAKIVPLFMRSSPDKGGLGLSTADVGIAYGFFGSPAFVIGSILGGYFVAKRGLKKSLLILAMAFNIPNVVYLLLAIFKPKVFGIVCGAIVVEWLGYGFGFVGVILYMMQQIAPGSYKMAHYSFATAIMNLGFMLPSMASGYISDHMGYRNFFIWAMIATIPSFLVAYLVPFRKTEED